MPTRPMWKWGIISDNPFCRLADNVFPTEPLATFCVPMRLKSLISNACFDNICVSHQPQGQSLQPRPRCCRSPSSGLASGTDSKDFLTVVQLGLSCRQSQANSSLLMATCMRVLLDLGCGPILRRT